MLFYVEMSELRMLEAREVLTVLHRWALQGYFARAEAALLQRASRGH